MKYRNIARQAGFTLVEIAIVLVIIGLLLGGVLKGQEMIENAKIKNGINDLNGVVAAYNSYIDRYKALPGDDGAAAGAVALLQARGGPWATITAAGNANGVIGATQANVFTAGGEALAFWQALKAAGFVAGNPADTGVAALPRNAFNGLTGVGAGVGAAATARFSVCLSQVPGKAARAIDIQLDDGVSNTGSITATVGATGANTAPGVVAAAPANYSDASIYTVCRTM